MAGVISTRTSYRNLIEISNTPIEICCSLAAWGNQIGEKVPSPVSHVLHVPAQSYSRRAGERDVRWGDRVGGM
jgi:hypothetical protein